MCGNKVCDVGENSANCCNDCGCSRGQVCNLISAVCVKRTSGGRCGDGVCNFGEDARSCCQDCPYCGQGEICDTQKQECVPEEISIKPEHAVSLFKLFLHDEGYSSDWVESQRYSLEKEVFEGQPVVRVCTVLPVGHEDFTELACARVTEGGRIVGYVKFW
jgi:hypothetical protein